MKKLIVIIISFLLIGCSENGISIYKEPEEVEATGKTLLLRARLEVNADNFEEAQTLYEQAHEKLETDEAALELSYLLYNNDDYQGSFDYVTLALERPEHMSEKYLHLGDSLFMLERFSEAEKAYQNSIRENSYQTYAYYGLGVINYEQGDYSHAVKDFEKVLKLEPSDSDAKYYKLDSLMYSSAYSDLARYAKTLIEEEPTLFRYYEYLDEALFNLNEEDQLLNLYDEMASLFTERSGVRLYKGSYYFHNEQYDLALAALKEVVEYESENPELYLWLSLCYLNLEQMDEAIEYGEIAIGIDGTYSSSYTHMGNLMQDNDKNFEAIDFFLNAVQYEESLENHLEVMNAMLFAKRFKRAITYGETVIQDYPNDADALWYLSQAYYERNEFESAIKCYENILELNPTEYMMYYNLVDAYLSMGNYEQFAYYLDIALEKLPDDEDVQAFKSYIEMQQLPSKDLVLQLFEDFYFYDGQTDWLKDQDIVLTPNNLDATVNRIKAAEDEFTFAVIGQYYAEQAEEIESLELKKFTEDVLFVRIPFFDTNVDHLFIEAIDQIEHSDEKILLIDMTSNFGGVTESAHNILDVLLPAGETLTLTYKNDYSESYYSDASFVAFEQIYVFVNNESASAAEVLTLSLKSHLDNVTIVGEQTYGKGVGQFVFDDMNSEVAYYIVNHSWSVNDVNIHLKGITPDVYKTEDELLDFMRATFE